MPNKNTLLLFTKSMIAIMVTITVCVLEIRSGGDTEMFKVVAAMVIGYIFGQRSTGDGKKGGEPK